MARWSEESRLKRETFWQSHLEGALITTARLNKVQPYACLKDVLERMSAGHLVSRLDDLWKPSAI